MRYKILVYKEYKHGLYPRIITFEKNYIWGQGFIPLLQPMSASLSLMEVTYPKLEFKDVEMIEVELTELKTNKNETDTV